MRSFIFSLLWLTLFLVASYLLWTYLLGYVLPFFLAIFFAVLIDPMVGSVERLKVPRGLAVAMVLLVVLGVLSALLVGAVAVINLELGDFYASLPQYYQGWVAAGQELLSRLGTFQKALPKSAQTVINNRLVALNQWAEQVVSKILLALSAASALPGLITTVLITLIATFFFSRDKRIIARFLLSLLPPAWKLKVIDTKAEVFLSTVGFVKAQLTLVTITALVTTIGLNLIGSKYSFVVGILSGLLDILPVLGPSLIFIPWITYHLAFGNTAFGIYVAIVYGIISATRQVLEPKIVGDRIGLHPLATLFALYLGLQIFGPAGVIMGPLTIIILKAMVKSGLLPIFQPDQEDVAR